MHIKIQEYIKINRSGVSNRDKTEQVYCWDDAAWQQSTQPLGCRTKAGSGGGGGGVLLGLPGFYRPTPEQLHFNIETCQPQKKIYIKKPQTNRQLLVGHVWSGFFSPCK